MNQVGIKRHDMFGFLSNILNKKAQRMYLSSLR